MQIIKADFILTMDTERTVRRGLAVAFDATVREIAPSVRLRKRYPDATFTDLGEGSVLMPALVNPHVHLEFSANRTSLKYGDFHTWLDSVITARDSVLKRSTEAVIADVLAVMAQSGTGTVGAISSYGYDLLPLVASGLKVVYFSETIGANPALLETMRSHLISRLDEGTAHADDRFFPGIAIHAPYSVHPELLAFALDEARNGGLPVTAHLLESPQERLWLEENRGDFAPFFKNFLHIDRAAVTPKAFLEAFDGLRPSFAHAIHTDDTERSMIRELGGSVIHCPVSNRLLHTGVMPLKSYRQALIPVALATDGLSSNRSLSSWDEMRAALMMHTAIPPQILAWDLLDTATRGGAAALNLVNGSVEEERPADLIALRLPDPLDHPDDLALQLILHTTEVTHLFINGERRV